jgi:hypothetical protein
VAGDDSGKIVTIGWAMRCLVALFGDQRMIRNVIGSAGKQIDFVDH